MKVWTSLKTLKIALLFFMVGCGGGVDIGSNSPGVDGFAKSPIAASGRTALGASAAPTVSGSTTTPTIERATLLAWAESTYKDYFHGAASDGKYGPYDYRFYAATGNYIGFDVDKVYVLGPLTDNELVLVGTLAHFACIILPNCGLSNTTQPTSSWVTTGNVHNLLKTWAAGGLQTVTGARATYMAMDDGSLRYDLDGKLRGLISSDGECSYSITAEGHIAYNGITYKYEPASGSTDTKNATKARLYSWNTTTNTVSKTFVEIDKTKLFLLKQTENSTEYPTAAKMADVCDSGKLGIASRFPTLGTFFNSGGTYTGEIRDIITDSGNTALPSNIRRGAACKIVINGAGQASVTLGTSQIPTFLTYDTSADNSDLRTMLSNNPFITPETTYALQFTLAPVFDGTFIVRLPKLVYWDLDASPSFSSSYYVFCVTSKIP